MQLLRLCMFFSFAMHLSANFDDGGQNAETRTNQPSTTIVTHQQYKQVHYSLLFVLRFVSLHFVVVVLFTLFLSCFIPPLSVDWLVLARRRQLIYLLSHSFVQPLTTTYLCSLPASLFADIRLSPDDRTNANKPNCRLIWSAASQMAETAQHRSHLTNLLICRQHSAQPPLSWQLTSAQRRVSNGLLW